MKQHEFWLLKAHNDLNSAKKLISGDDPITDTGAYHTHQCAEKALKGYLAFHKKPVEKTNDIQLLLEKCMKIDFDFKLIYDDGISLNPYATEFRYPGLVINPDLNDVVEAVSIAEKILHFIKEKIGSDFNK